MSKEQRSDARRWLAMTNHDHGAVNGERSWPQRAAILLLAVLQVAIPSLPALGIGEPIGDQSDSVRTLITPAGWAFSIWGPLFAGCLAYALFQILPAQTRNSLLARIGWPSAGPFSAALGTLHTVFGELIRAHIIFPLDWPAFRLPELHYSRATATEESDCSSCCIGRSCLMVDRLPRSEHRAP